MINFKGIRIHKNGEFDVLQPNELSFNRVPANFALVKNLYSGINFIDIYQRTGLYEKELPFIPGMEGGGVVEEVNSSKGNIKVGDEVVYIGAFGSYSEYSIVPLEKLCVVPKSLSLRTVVASFLQGLTAEFLTNFIYPLKENDTCLIHAAAGGVGVLLVQIAKMSGARVLGTVSNEQKASSVMEAGADEVIIYKDYDFKRGVENITNGEGVSVVYDSVGKGTFEQSLNCLKKFGMMVSYGNSSGPVPSISPMELHKKGSLFLSRPSLLHYIEDPVRLKASADKLFDYLLKDRLKINVGLELPLEEAAEAHRLLESRVTQGKILLRMGN